jgi:hypothetical protein
LVSSLDPIQWDRKLQLFAAACCRRIWELLTSDVARRLVELTEQRADGEMDLVAMRTTVKDLDVGRQGDRAAREAAALDCRNWVASQESYLRAAACAENAVADVMPAASVQELVTRANRRVAEYAAQLSLFRDIVGNPFRPVAFAPEWRTSTAIALARGMYESRDFGAMPILADALQDAGCDNDDILDHCRGEKQAHVRGCWVVDLVLGKS